MIGKKRKITQRMRETVVSKHPTSEHVSRWVESTTFTSTNHLYGWDDEFLHMDSLDQLEIAMRVEDEFLINISDDELIHLDSIRSTTHLIVGKIPAIITV